MLQQLLNEIRSGGTLQPAALAVRLNISVQMVNMMLEDLERRHIIEQVQTGCGSSCGGCGLVGECAINHPKGRMWIMAKR